MVVLDNSTYGRTEDGRGWKRVGFHAPIVCFGKPVWVDGIFVTNYLYGTNYNQCVERLMHDILLGERSRIKSDYQKEISQNSEEESREPQKRTRLRKNKSMQNFLAKEFERNCNWDK